MKPVRMTRLADLDLSELLAESRKLWGEKLTTRYEDAIADGLERIGANPDRFPVVDRTVPGIRRLRVGRHVLFFRDEPEAIVVIRVLHERMDWRRKI